MIHTNAALRRPVTTVMLFVALVVIGLISARLLPIEQFPDITWPGMGVSIPFPGSTPEEVEQLITKPVEEALSTLGSIQRIESTSSDNQANFFIQFAIDADPQATAFEVRTKVDSIRGQLPAGADRILMFSGGANDEPILTVRISAAEDLSDSYDLLERVLKKPVQRIDGVARVELAGADPKEIRVLVDATLVAAHHVDIGRLLNLLQQSNFSVSAGEITERGQRFNVRPIGEFHSLDDIRNLVVQGNVRLGDVADVAYLAPDRTIGRHLDRRPSVGFDVFKTSKANTVKVVSEALKVIESARELPQMQGISVYVIGNQADAIQSSLKDLRNAGIIGAIFGFFVLMTFLRDIPTTLIVSLAVQVSLIITLAALYFLGMSINVMTMMGMLLAVGILVDNAVVITESIFRHRQLDPTRPLDATLTGVKEVGVAVLAGTASMIIVFVPIIFGERSMLFIFLTHVAVPICVAMITSLFVAQTIIPMLTTRFPPPPPLEGNRGLSFLQRKYEVGLRWVLRHPRWTGAIAVAVLLSGAAPMMMGLVKVDPFPQGTSRQIVLDYRLDGNYPLERVEAAVNIVEDYLYKNKDKFDIDNVYSRFDAGSANSVLILTPKNKQKVDAADLMEIVQKDMPEIIIGKPTFKLDGQDQGHGFSLELSGESTELLGELSLNVARVVNSVEGLESVHSEAKSGQEEVQIIVDRDRATRLGLGTQDIAAAVAVAMRGQNLHEFRGADRDINMRLVFRSSDKQTVDDLAGLPLYLPNGERITLGAVARFHVTQGARDIQRINKMTSVVVTGNLKKDATLDEVGERVTSLMDAYPLPPGYSWHLGRGSDEQDDTADAMKKNLLLAIAMIYLVISAMFESIILPVAVLSSILFAFVGVFWCLGLTNTPMTLMAMIGLLVLIGVVVNAGIVLVSHINNLRASGMPREEAIVQAGHDRLRPILMTTFTTLLGLSPLALFKDAQVPVGGAGFGLAWYPLARTVMGGLAFSAAVSLFFVPAFYVSLDKFIDWMRRIRDRARRKLAAVKAAN
ncbi:MAG: efflux RND transporter permease subunit [Steroidobacterales bacterium]